jgi:aspartate aminotransferase
VTTKLRAMKGVKLADIAGTFYAFPDVGALLGKKAGNHVINSVDELCDWLLDVHGVAAVPGTAFGCDTSIRLSFAASEVDLAKALARIAKGLGEIA